MNQNGEYEVDSYIEPNSEEKFLKEKLLVDINRSECSQLTSTIASVELQETNQLSDRKTIAWNLIKNAAPTALSLILEITLQLICMAFIGHKSGTIVFDGIGLGILLVNMVSTSITMGLNGALDTLVSQAYGSKQYYLCGTYFNKARLLHAILFIPIGLILLFSNHLLAFVGQNKETVDVAHKFLYLLIPGLFAFNQYETFRRFLQNMQVFYLTMCIQGATILLHILWNYIFIIVLDLEVFGAALSLCITNFLNLILLNVYLLVFKNTIEKESWHYMNADTFKNWKEYLKYAIPSMLGDSLNWWSYLVLGFVAGKLSTT